MMLKFENVFPVRLIMNSICPRGFPLGHLGLGSLFLRHEGRARGRLGDLDAGQPRFLKTEKKHGNFFIDYNIMLRPLGKVQEHVFLFNR